MSGATFDWTFDQPFHPPVNWELDGNAITTVVDEVATSRGLSLTLRVETKTLLDRLRALKTDEGQLDTLTTDSGGFVAVDRAGGGNSFKLSPPGSRRPLRKAGTYHVEAYEETLVSATVDEWDVEVEFVPDANRMDDHPINQNNSGATFDWTFDQPFKNNIEPNEWLFDTRHGGIVTERVDAEFAGTGADGVERFEVVARLTFDQALSFESALSRLGGVRVREISDGSNVPVDETGGANTVAVQSPTPDVVASGDYVVMEWESRRINDSFQEVAFELARPSA